MHFLEADGLAGEHGTEANLLVTERDAAANSYDRGFVVEGIVDIGQAPIGGGWRAD